MPLGIADTNIDLTKIGLFILGIALVVEVLTLIPALFGLPNDLPFDISNIFHTLVSGLYLFDFVLPVAMMLRVFQYSLVFEVGMIAADGALWIWSAVTRIHP